MRERVSWLIIAAIAVTVCFCTTDVYAFADPIYGIDSIYDDVNPNWLDTTPTFVGGETYDVTIVGHGELGSGGIPLPPQSFVSMGMFIDYYGVGPTDWSSYSGTPLVSGGSIELPLLQFEKGYEVAGSFTVPSDVETRAAQSAFAWLHGSYLHPPESAQEAIDESLATEFFTVQLEAAPVPEPSSLALLTFGLAGGIYRKRFGKKS